jgi:hypothetical protein
MNRNLAIFLKNWLNYGYWKLPKNFHFSSFNSQFHFWLYINIYIYGQQKKGHQLSKVGQVNSLFHGTPYTYRSLCQTFETNHCGRLNLNPDQVKFICFGHRERDCTSGVVHSGIKFWLKLDQYVSDIWSTTCAYDWWACFMEVHASRWEVVVGPRPHSKLWL